MKECSWCNGNGKTTSSLGEAVLFVFLFGGFVGGLIGFIIGKGWF